MYSGVRISEIVKKNSGIGGVLGLLWFQRELPEYFCKFLELCLIVTADHGPAVSGAHNTIVAARAGTVGEKYLCTICFVWCKITVITGGVGP